MTKALTQNPDVDPAGPDSRLFESDAGRRLRVLVLSTPFPSNVDSTRGIFVKERVKAFAALPGIELRVISPVPWFPPIKRFSRWYKWSQYPQEEVFEGLKIYHPRYFLPPKVGGYIHPQLMYPAAKHVADRLRKEGFEFDVIDAHFVYPNGVVAAKLGRRYGVPVMMTGRGEDMLRFPQMPFKGRSIRWALQQATHCVALSSEIAEAMKHNGASADKVTVIPNGVDTETFRPLPQQECREKLGLPADAKIILSVGDRLELKGFHILVDAMPEILKTHPKSLIVIVGGPGRSGTDYTIEIRRRIAQLKLKKSVLLVGCRPHEELPWWYSAADIFTLMSSREGSPNVVLEALACGTPAAGTPVGGIPDVLKEPNFGILLAERSQEAAEYCLTRALSRQWNRCQIRTLIKDRTWHETARQVDAAFDRAFADFASLATPRANNEMKCHAQDGFT